MYCSGRRATVIVGGNNDDLFARVESVIVINIAIILEPADGCLLMLCGDVPDVALVIAISFAG